MNKKLFFMSLLISTTLIFQGASYYGIQSGYQTTKEDGAEFGYYLPTGIQKVKGTIPLVVIFGQKAMEALKWQDLADTHKLIILAIQPKRGGRWVIQADSSRAEAKIKDVLQRYPVDPKRVWTFGYGRNGVFALLTAINNPGLISAAAGIDTTVVNTFVSGGDVGDGQFVGVFSFSKDPKRQIPILLVNFKNGNLVSDANQQSTEEVLVKYGYPVTYKTFSGSTHFPKSQDLDQVYAWFKSLEK